MTLYTCDRRLERRAVALVLRESIFDHTFDLQQLYPRRRRFYLSEFTGFAGVMCGYFCATGERETAALYYWVLKQVASRHPMTKHAKRTLHPPLWVRILRKWAGRRAEKANTTERSDNG